MKTGLILVGKTANKLFIEGIKDYISRINHYMPFDISVIPDVKNTKALSVEQQKGLEGNAILHILQPSDTLVLLDEHGSDFSSVDFAQWLNTQQQITRRLLFCIGGSYGFSQSVYARANYKISLSKMTFSHQMVRLIFVEQLYRACTILRGEPYHHA